MYVHALLAYRMYLHLAWPDRMLHTYCVLDVEDTARTPIGGGGEGAGRCAGAGTNKESKRSSGCQDGAVAWDARGKVGRHTCRWL